MDKQSLNEGAPAASSERADRKLLPVIDSGRSDAAVSAASFSVKANEPAGLAKSLREARLAVKTPSLGVVFLTGAVGARVREVGRVVAEAWKGVPTLIATGVGVVSDRGNHEDDSAATGLLASGGHASPFCVTDGSLGDTIRDAKQRGATSFLLFAEADQLNGERVDELTRAAAGAPLMGGGTPEHAPAIVDVEGRVRSGAVVGLAQRGLRAQLGVSPAARVLGQRVHEVTSTSGPLLLELDGKPALDALTEATRGLSGKPLVLGLLPGPDPDNPLRGGRLRPIRGVDPGRRGVALGEAIAAGDKVSFVVVDGGSARTDLDALARELWTKTAGGMPSFGVLVSCAGRRSSLYGSPEVETRILRQRFDKVPFAGLHSAFELGPSAGGPSIHYYSGAVGLFSVPS